LISINVGLVEFLGPRLSSEELSQIWAMGDKSFHVVDNLHGVLAAAAPKLGAPQFDHLLHLVQEVSSSFCFPLFYLPNYFFILNLEMATKCKRSSPGEVVKFPGPVRQGMSGLQNRFEDPGSSVGTSKTSGYFMPLG
jgi:hypothetical protein